VLKVNKLYTAYIITDGDFSIKVKASDNKITLAMKLAVKLSKEGNG